MALLSQESLTQNIYIEPMMCPLPFWGLGLEQWVRRHHNMHSAQSTAQGKGLFTGTLEYYSLEQEWEIKKK